MSVVNAVVSFQMLKFWNVQIQFLRFNLIVLKLFQYCDICYYHQLQGE